MPSTTEKETIPPFPTRYPIRPPLALPRRSRNEVMPDWPKPEIPILGMTREAERALRLHEMALADRERAVAEAEARLAERTRDLAEMEALLHAREELLASSLLRHPDSRGIVTLREAEALNHLKKELEQQEVSLREARQAVRDREKFLEDSENKLFAKVQEQQEKESELEQREENLAARLASLAKTDGNVPVVAAPRPYDEFRE